MIIRNISQACIGEYKYISYQIYYAAKCKQPLNLLLDNFSYWVKHQEIIKTNSCNY